MDRERWQEIDRLFASVLERPASERAAFLDQACAGDPELRKEVESLLAHDQPESFMELSASEAAARLVIKDLTPPLAGQTVGHYEIQKQLGAGGMGEVFLAHDTRLNRRVALKLLPTNLTKDEARVHRFRREALAASALNHPNILTIYEIEENCDRPFIATEFVEGVTLRTRIRSRRLSLADALDIALQIAGALAAAHEAGIIHRDIKPENIMLRPDGLVKVLDFGIAKYAEPSRPRDSKEGWIKTATGVVMGTASYMSPEQARGLPVDARTDIWSLGVILYEMIARRLPFTGKTPADRVAAILEREPEPLSKLRRNIPPALEKIVQHALAKNRDERYGRATDLIKDLREQRAALGDERQRSFSLPRLAQGIPGLSNWRARVAIIAVLAILVTAGLAAYLMLGRDNGKTTPSVAAINSLAVLPLVNVGGDADAEYLSDGITESLINDLSRLPNLKVMSRNSVFRYKGQELEANAVASALHVQAVLTGRVIQRGNALTVSVELVDARDNSHLWGEQYNRKLADLVALQSEIARDASRKLRAQLTSADEQRLAKNYTQNSEAYQLYLKGRYHVLKTTAAEAQKGIAYFQQAIDVDPSYALAYTGLANAYRVLTLTGGLSEQMTSRAKAAAEKAVEIDDSLAEAHATLGFIVFWFDWNWSESEKHIRRALELEPNIASAFLNFAHLSSNLGHHDQAIALAQRAIELDPLWLMANSLYGQFLFHAGRFDEAIAQARKTLELEPGFWHPHLILAYTHLEKGMYDEAVAEASKARELSGGNIRAIATIGCALARAGKREEARAILAQLRKLSTERYVSPYHFALVYAALGEREEAIALLEQAYQHRDAPMVFLKIEQRWNTLRDDPRFVSLLERMRLL